MKRPIPGLNELISRKHGIILLILFSVFFISPHPVFCSEEISSSIKNKPDKSVLSEATMCEEMKDGLPLNRSILFSIEKGKVLCFTSFDNIPERTTIFHKWFFRDKLIYKIKLSLKPPRWSTFSSIKLRDTDRGPWRVEIIDQQNHLYQTMRFSITD